jgi:predicted acylesterase/phospholipase RssA
VSGGSIVAAHLLLNWKKYNSKNGDEFRQIAGELIAFIRSDVRGRLIRRWVLAGSIPRYRRVNQLIKAYDDLYEEALLERLEGPGRPNLSILATSLITGDLCAFTSRGIRVNCLSDKDSEVVPIPHLRVSNAVAASSAFPPLFPPVKLGESILGIIGKKIPSGEILSDGGVIDNLSIAALPKESQAQLFVSDASAGFEIRTKQKYGLIFNRTVRSTDILMSRIPYWNRKN